MPETAARWRNRIVDHGTEVPDQLLANPRNWRIHPKAQQDALSAQLDRVGWVQDVIVNRQTGHLIDGHLRVSLAISREEPEIPVVYVDLDPDEEALVLASLDPLAGMAVTDSEQLAELLSEIAIPEGELAALVRDAAGLVDTVAFPALPEGERGIRQMTFTVTAAQQDIIEAAVAVARPLVADDTGNENGNGNALALICEDYTQ